MSIKQICGICGELIGKEIHIIEIKDANRCNNINSRIVAVCEDCYKKLIGDVKRGYSLAGERAIGYTKCSRRDF